MQFINLVVTGLESRIKGDPGKMSPVAVPAPRRLPSLKHPLQATMKKILLIAALALAVSAVEARAGHVSFGISVGLPVAVCAPVYAPPPVYVAPAPVAYAPAPVYVATPAQVVYAPAPVTYVAAPVVYAPGAYAPGYCVGASVVIGGGHYWGGRWGHGYPPPHGGWHAGGYGRR